MLYHVNGRFFRDGDIIMPGTYGQAARTYRHKNPIPQETAAPFAWEIAFETARLCISPMILSRLDCVFVWETEKQAREFKERFRPENRCIFEVEPTLDDFKSFRGNYELIDNRAESYVDFMCRDAVTYWRDPPQGSVETLIGCPVRVIRQVA